MADSIERIADEMAACIDHGNGSLTVNSSRVIDWRDRLRALSPAGGDWVMVPREPTKEMCAAGERERLSRPTNMNPYHVWAAMLAASPQQEPGAVPSDDELTGMWERADLIGGATDCFTPADESGLEVSMRAWRTMANDVHSRFFWMLSPDKKGNHTVSHESVRAVVELCEEIEAGTPAYENIPAIPSGQTLAGADVLHPQYKSGFKAGLAFEAEHRLLTATSAGTTGDDSEDAARWRFVVTTGKLPVRCSAGYYYEDGVIYPTPEAAIDAARRARGAE